MGKTRDHYGGLQTLRTGVSLLIRSIYTERIATLSGFRSIVAFVKAPSVLRQYCFFLMAVESCLNDEERV